MCLVEEKSGKFNVINSSEYVRYLRTLDVKKGRQKVIITTEEAAEYQKSIMDKIERNFQKEQRQKNATYKERGEAKQDRRI